MISVYSVFCYVVLRIVFYMSFPTEICVKVNLLHVYWLTSFSAMYGLIHG